MRPPHPLLFLLLAPLACKEAPPRSAPDASQAAFLAAYPVLMHPRCVNCHPMGDAPLVGEESLPHPQHVARGPDGLGFFAMRCGSCHQPGNVPGEHMPPGTPNWHLPPPETPMVFEGRSPRELALQLKDKERNGGKTLEEILEHVERDNLVLWGWEPGDGRSKPPLSHAAFVARMREWVETGAVAPE